jgi:hypothetical protein
MPLDHEPGWEQNGWNMVRFPTTTAASTKDAHRASLLGGVVVVVSLIIGLLLVTQA